MFGLYYRLPGNSHLHAGLGKSLTSSLIKAVEDFGEIGIDLQSVGLEEYKNPREAGGGFGYAEKCKRARLAKLGHHRPHHQTRILAHFASGQIETTTSYSISFPKICFLGGLGISLPAILYFIGGFVVPGLTPKEKRVFFPGCIAATFLFVAGASMTYLFILPVSLAFTIEFSFNVLGLDVYRPEAGNYYSTVIWMTFAVGIAFQFPLVLILLIRIGILSVDKLRASRRLVLVILMISAALITPGGDPVSLCILTIPLYVLYELAIIIGSSIERKKAILEWKEWDESLQGPKPKNPPKVKGTPLWAYGVFLLIFGSATFLIWRNKDEIKENFDAFTNRSSNNNPEKTPDSNQSNSLPKSIQSDYPEFPEANQTFILQLVPIKQQESNQSEIQLFEAKLIDPLNNER